MACRERPPTPRVRSRLLALSTVLCVLAAGVAACFWLMAGGERAGGARGSQHETALPSIASSGEQDHPRRDRSRRVAAVPSPSRGTPSRRVGAADRTALPLAHALEDDGLVIAGRVYDRNARAIGSALATLVTDDERTVTTATDDEGRFEFREKTGDVVIAADGYMPQRIPGVRAGDSLNVSLRQPVSITLRVRDKHGPVPRATVALRSTSKAPRFWFDAQTATDEHGLCTFEGLPDGRWAILSVDSDAHVPFEGIVTLKGGSEPEDVQLMVGARQEGQVRDDVYDAPVAGARVAVVRHGVPTTTDGLGRFSLVVPAFRTPISASARSPGVTVHVNASGYAACHVTLAVDQPFLIKLRPSRRIRGRLVGVDAQRTSGATLSVWRVGSRTGTAATTSASESGEFSVDVGDAGTYLLAAEWGDGVAERMVAVDAQSRVVDIGDVSVKPGRRLRCVVTDGARRQRGVRIRVGRRVEDGVEYPHEIVTDAFGLAECRVAAGTTYLYLPDRRGHYSIDVADEARGTIVVEIACSNWSAPIGRVVDVRLGLVFAELSDSNVIRLGDGVWVVRGDTFVGTGRVILKRGDYLLCQLDADAAMMDGPMPGDAIVAMEAR